MKIADAFYIESEGNGQHPLDPAYEPPVVYVDPESIVISEELLSIIRKPDYHKIGVSLSPV